MTFGGVVEDWKPIPEFEGYSVSTQGRVRNDDTGRIMVLVKNDHETIFVGMMKGEVQRKRSVALLVCSAFVPSWKDEKFDTPIHLDGDRTNNIVDNLQWRPYWFARMYHAQFLYPQRGYSQPFEDLDTGEVYPNSWEAAIFNGLLEKDLIIATDNRTYVFPTWQRFGRMPY